MNKNNENNFAIISISNLIILIIYFASREKQNDIFFQDALVVVIQVFINLFLAAVFSGSYNELKEQNETEILDEDGNSFPQKDRHFSRSKSFLLSALLVLLIGFGLCSLGSN
jgi:hypothetical protein